jgi:alkyl hydroperoxide reductase subunit AhpC
VHLAWQRHEKDLQKVAYSMGSDPTGRLARLFGVYDAGSGLALRGTFVVSPDGTLFNSEVNFYNLGRNIEELLRKVKANIYLAKKPAEVCPAKWKDEGDKTLKPGPELVGRVHEALNEGAPGKSEADDSGGSFRPRSGDRKADAPRPSARK